MLRTLPPNSDAADVIAALALKPHPEGGWYRETFRSLAPPGERAAMTAIHFLLDVGQQSHWHCVDAEEIWCWHAGAPLELGIACRASATTQWHVLGPDVLAGQRPQCIVAAGEWQAARAGDGWALVSCVVAPGFEFAGFTMAPAGWSPG